MAASRKKENFFYAVVPNNIVAARLIMDKLPKKTPGRICVDQLLFNVWYLGDIDKTGHSRIIPC